MKIQLEIFEGPLDLLIYLIKKDHLDVHDIPIQKITKQYLQYIELMKILDINIASEYLLMAATLISIKAKMLLPRPPDQDEEQQDPREELVQQILEYEKFKNVAEFLQTKEQERKKYLTRSTINPQEKDLYLEVSVFDLITAFKRALQQVPKDVFFEVLQDQYSVEQKIQDILRLLKAQEKILLQELFENARNKYEIIAFFLAILELIKVRAIKAVQEQLFAPILIIASQSEYDDTVEESLGSSLTTQSKDSYADTKI